MLLILTLLGKTPFTSLGTAGSLVGKLEVRKRVSGSSIEVSLIHDTLWWWKAIMANVIFVLRGDSRRIWHIGSHIFQKIIKSKWCVDCTFCISFTLEISSLESWAKGKLLNLESDTAAIPDSSSVTIYIRYDGVCSPGYQCLINGRQYVSPEEIISAFLKHD